MENDWNRSITRLAACRSCFSRLLAKGLLFALSLAVAQGAMPMPPGKHLMQLTSSAFKTSSAIQKQFTCEGKNVSPPLTWTGTPAKVKSFALIADDPDAPSGTWVHWVVYDLPATTTELPEDTPKSQLISGNAKQGITDFKQVGYGGPCPPPGKPHRYFFKLYALDEMLNLKPGATKKDIEKAMTGHILATAELVGTYERK